MQPWMQHPDAPSRQRGTEKAHSDAEEHAHGYVPEEMGRHHDAAEGDERGPKENAHAVNPVPAVFVIEPETQPRAHGEAE